MKRLLAAGIVASFALAVPAALPAQTWSEGFESGLGSARSYMPGDGTVLELGHDRAGEGEHHVRAVLPGSRPLEGLNVTATGLAGGRVVTVAALVRGKGQVWLCLISGNGWLYSPDTVTLTDQWQEVSLAGTLPAADKTLGIHFLTRSVAQHGAVFEVDRVEVKSSPAPAVFDAEVGPWRFEAEDYALRRPRVVEQPSALGGRAIDGGSYLELAGLPFPRTGRPVTIAVRVRPGSLEESYRLTTRQAGIRETLATVRPQKAGQWQWLRFRAVTAGEIGDSFGLEAPREKGAAGDMLLDAVALTTRADLDEGALAAATDPLALDGPRAVVARAAEAPSIDGRGDDACWQHTVACTDFPAVRSLAPAQAGTTVRSCYDDRNLYLLFACQEPILNVAGQRRGEFRASVAERDGNVSADDSVVVLLDPANTGKEVFDLTANALGTLADARCTGPDLWAGRDIKWNSGARAKALIGQDAWTLEMAIPLADLGAKPKPGDAWQCCFGRLAKARKETTSWNPSGRGFHEPKQLGTLVFGEAVPGVLLNTPAALEMGKSPLSVALVGADREASGIYLAVDTVVPQANTHARHYTFAAVRGEPTAVASAFQVPGEGEFQVGYAVLDAATLTPWYTSPRLTRTARSSLAKVTLACEGPYELYLNDERIGRGTGAAGEPIEAPLQTGANVFALKLQQGSAAIRVEAPGSRFTAETWKMSADGPDAASASLDDRPWPMATRVGEHLELGPVVGQSNRPTVLRRTLLWQKTRVWPTPEPASYLARGPAQHLTLRTEGLPGKVLEGWTTWLAVPPEFELVGSTGFYGRTSPGQPEFVCTQLGIQQVDGRPMRLAKIAADKPLRSGRHYIMSELEAFVRYREEAGEPESVESHFVYWSEANAGNVSEPAQTIRVQVLPKLDGRQPKQLTFQLWGGWFGNIDDAAMREEILRCAQAAGFNDLVAHDRWTGDTAPGYGLAVTLSINFEPWGLDLAPYLKEHPDQRLVTLAGQADDRLMCTSLLLGDGWPAAQEALKRRLEEIRPGTVDIDYEHGPKNGPHSCYCPRCLDAFRRFGRLDPATGLTAEVVQEKHGDLWIDFMAYRVAQVLARFKEATHRLAPTARFSVYSGYQTPENPRVYGINWQYVGDLGACDRAGAGYGAPESDIARTIDVLQGIPLLPGLLVTPYERTATVPVAPLTRAGVLRVLLAGSGGLLVYDRCSLDGRCWRAVADVSRLAAGHEQVFLKGKPALALPGFEITQVQKLSAAGTTLVCALNVTSRPVDYAIPLPVEAGGGAEFYTGRPVAAGEQVACRLEPGQAAVYVLRPPTPTQ
ncbi:MAG: sugar-binding protein [Thermoguttaceae bacterium]